MKRMNEGNEWQMTYRNQKTFTHAAESTPASMLVDGPWLHALKVWWNLRWASDGNFQRELTYCDNDEQEVVVHPPSFDVFCAHRMAPDQDAATNLILLGACAVHDMGRIIDDEYDITPLADALHMSVSDFDHVSRLSCTCVDDFGSIAQYLDWL